MSLKSTYQRLLHQWLIKIGVQTFNMCCYSVKLRVQDLCLYVRSVAIVPVCNSVIYCLQCSFMSDHLFLVYINNPHICSDSHSCQIHCGPQVKKLAYCTFRNMDIPRQVKMLPETRRVGIKQVYQQTRLKPLAIVDKALVPSLSLIMYPFSISTDERWACTTKIVSFFS